MGNCAIIDHYSFLPIRKENNLHCQNRRGDQGWIAFKKDVLGTNKYNNYLIKFHNLLVLMLLVPYEFFIN